MRIGIGAKVNAWDGSDIDQKLVDLLNEFYVPTTLRGIVGYAIKPDNSLLEVPGIGRSRIIEREDAIGDIQVGIRATKHFMELAQKRIEAAEDELQSIISTCGSKTGRFAGYDTYEDYLKSEHWQAVRHDALLKYDGKCALVAKHGQAVHVHHRTYERLGMEHPEDVIVLCSDCHAKHHDKEA